ncbi:hypothetical protein PIB30_025953 [Stylosanthes scabra]|uniref:Uncharacterized protein n=1 Tax=Stylosanthes scabra TaxID=79078 RepID=A0ABU6RAI9_9FABA|nr:hypothetical protein [Stylosanthes scabra]
MASVGELGASSSSKLGYEWVNNVVWSIPTKFDDAEGVKRLGPPSAWVREGSSSQYAWGYMGAFQILMKYLEESPSLDVFFYLFQAKYVDKGIWVTLSSHQGRTGGKVLNTSTVLKWDSNKEYVIYYLEEKIPDCNTSSLKSFFKQRAEKELSSSQVVKIEKGTEVNKPVKRRRLVSLKKMRSEEASRKKVINLTEGKCCGKDVSLEEVANFTKSHRSFQGFHGAKDLSCELSVV